MYLPTQFSYLWGIASMSFSGLSVLQPVGMTTQISKKRKVLTSGEKPPTPSLSGICVVRTALACTKTTCLFPRSSWQMASFTPS